MEDERPKPFRASCANALGVLNVLCLLGAIGSYALTVWFLKNMPGDEPPFFPGGIFVLGLLLTFPTSLVSAIAAVILVGFRRSRLAWITFLTYTLLLGGGIALAVLMGP